jgi:hypothetical protein
MAGIVTRQPLTARAIVVVMPTLDMAFVTGAGGGRSRRAGPGLCLTGH